jgi:NADPH:quinone reductase
MARSHAIRIHAHGGPENLRYESIDVGDPGPQQVRIRHTAIGINFTDMHHRTGRYPGGPFPVIIGMEAAGVVDAIGADVTGFQIGDRVAYGGASPSLMPGAYTELRVMDPKWLVPVPAWIDDETAAAVTLKGLTAQYLLFSSYPVQAGQAILIHAAAGGVGLIMGQWAHHLGATVIGTVSSAEKAALILAHGYDHALLSTQDDLVARVRELTGGRGVDVVYDSVGAATFESSLASVRKRGMVVSFGSASGPVPPLELFRLNRMGSLYVTGAGLADYISERGELLARAEAVYDAVHRGVVQVRINQRYPLADAERAHRDLESRRNTGSSILVV